jgi:Zn-dependent peptidase ImmA (M78 family)
MKSSARTWTSENVLRFTAAAGELDPIEAVRKRAGAVIGLLPGPPYPLASETVQEALGVSSIRYARKLSADGRIFLQNGTYVIEISTRMDKSRRAFTLGHELGHALFLPFEPKERMSRQDTTTGTFARDNEEEYLCDVAAAELLMPKDMFSGRLAVYGPSVRSMLRLANDFGSSLLSTARRFVEVNVWKSHVGFWRVEQGEARLDVGLGVPNLTWKIPRGYTAAVGSVVSRAAETKRRVTGWSDVGLISRRGERLGEIFAEAIPVAGGKTIISVAVFERYPEHLCGMLDKVDDRVVNDLRIQPRFRFDAGSL